MPTFELAVLLDDDIASVSYQRQQYFMQHI